MKKASILNNKNKLFQIIVIVIFIAFIMYNLFWFLFVLKPYNEFTKNIPQNGDSIIVSIDNISYSVKKPSYLSIIGNLSLIDESSGEGLIIWPSMSSRYKYAAIITTEVVEIEEKQIPKQCVIAIDENGDWADYSGTFGEKEKLVLKSKKNVIQKWIKLADKMWNISS